MGKSGAVKGNMNSWAKRKLVDLAFEEGIKMITEQIGVSDKSKLAVLTYHVGRFLLDLKKGKMKEFSDLIIKSVSLGAKGADYLEETLRTQHGIDLNQPLNKNEALSRSIGNYLNQANSEEEKKVTKKYKSTHE